MFHQMQIKRQLLVGEALKQRQNKGADTAG